MRDFFWFKKRRLIKKMQDADPALSVSKSGANPLLVLKYLPLIEKHLNEYERVQNAGGSYMTGEGHTGDGLLALTNSRMIFVFEEEYEKSPWFLFFDQIRDLSFGTTDLVPISEMMTINYSEGQRTETKDIIVGRFYAQEIRNALVR